MGGACSAYGGEERRIQGFGGETGEGGTPFGRSGRKWKDNVLEVEWSSMDWSDLAQDKGKVAGFCDCGNEPSGSLK